MDVQWMNFTTGIQWIWILLFIIVVIIGYLYADKLKLLLVPAILVAQNSPAIPSIAGFKTAGDDETIWNELRALPALTELGDFDPAQGASGYVGSCVSRNFVADGHYVKVYPMCCRDCRARAHYWMYKHVDSELVIPYVARYMQVISSDTRNSRKEYTVLISAAQSEMRLLQRNEFCNADKVGTELPKNYDKFRGLNTSYENVVKYREQILLKNLDMAVFHKSSVLFY